MEKPNLKKWIVIAIPFAAGAIGFFLSGLSPLDALFSAVCLYFIGITDSPPNFLVEIARWTAPVATAGGVLFLFSSLRKRLRYALRCRRGNSVAVYGPEPVRKGFLASLGIRGIEGGELSASFQHAQSYLLLGEEEENLSFCHQYRDRLNGRNVYLRCRSVQPQAGTAPELRLFCPEETAARLYWKKHCLYEESVKHDHRLSIAIVGFGTLGQELLLYALQDNIFHPNQQITYHMFGERETCRRFLAVHTQLDHLEDAVVFHDEPWFDSMPVLEEACRVLITEQKGQLELVNQLLSATLSCRLYAFLPEYAASVLFAGESRLTVCPLEEAFQPDYVLSDALYDRAKRINLRYAHLYSGVEETETAKEEAWRSLDGFTRYSNISSADYHEIQLRMLETMGETPDRISVPCLELLAELEHIRWCRYHWLNNWRYGIPENGKRKDPEHRIHADLVPYQKLTDAEKEKDRENIRVLFSVTQQGNQRCDSCGNSVLPHE